jgi:hypothetical protein
MISDIDEINIHNSAIPTIPVVPTIQVVPTIPVVPTIQVVSSNIIELENKSENKSENKLESRFNIMNFFRRKYFKKDPLI